MPFSFFTLEIKNRNDSALEKLKAIGLSCSLIVNSGKSRKKLTAAQEHNPEKKRTGKQKSTGTLNATYNFYQGCNAYIPKPQRPLKELKLRISESLMTQKT